MSENAKLKVDRDEEAAKQVKKLGWTRMFTLFG